MNTPFFRPVPQILLAVSSAAFAAGVLAAVGQQNPPPGPGHVPDYFGVTPNYATSPQPILSTVAISDPAGTGMGAVAAATTYDYTNNVQTDKIMDVQVLTPGSGYSPATTVTVTGGPGSTPVSLTPIINAGAITGFQEIPSAANVVVNFAGLGSGFKTPIAGTGIRKFVDSLPMLGLPGVAANNLGQILPIAVADTTTFPGSDYYVIAEREYTKKMHSDLPETHLRGYVQLDANGNPMGPIQYLGPIIVAQKNRPIRIKLINQLSTGAAGKLPLPVDTSYIGADNPENTDNRTALHLHGGNVPWISDGTPRQWVKPAGEAGPNKGESARNVPDMWFDASGNLINDPSCKQGTTTCGVVGATNNPGDGALTFYYSNEQSARLMFYHDHAEGITRLNVYAGIAAGYVLQDPFEQALVNDGTLPPLADTIPLVIQDKTFVPDNTRPVLNFYGPFASALTSQDPTWRWGSGTAAPGLNGNGDLWVPHVFMPNQNPGDISGSNPFGRWDYGPWFWPPFATITNPPLPNPYYDPSCNVSTTYCEGQFIPGVPNGSSPAILNGGDLTRNPPIQPLAGGVAVAEKNGAITDSPSATLESFNDTPLVNGTAYPYINVDPKKYRFRILSVGNDRWFNLSLVVAASKNSIDTSAAGNTGTANNSILCDGTTNVDPADCTEVKMVPFDAAQNKVKPFPSHWYTMQKGGVTFDGRPSGVFDPATRGPEMVQIGTEGGFLPAPVAIKNQPVNFVYNPKNILVGNIKEHALLLGPAERADVIVDFSKFAGSTLILYNDAPAPIPAWDLRIDYYTGNFDNTDTGGAFSVVPGYGPNTRTVMQIRVSTNGGTSTHPVDDIGSIDMAALTAKIQAAFKNGQDPIIVPQSAYNPVYGTNVTDSLGTNLSRISDNWLTYTPLKDPATGTLEAAPVTLELEPKTIIEDWTMNWGRMNALLGTEVPRTTAINQTSIPQAYVDPPTELVKLTPNDNMTPISGTLPDGTQLWKVTHNGVDSHAIHFHLFNVQLIDRIGWDGAVYPPAANELGWKDTIIMHPLSDVVVALRPMNMTLPFKVPNSHRLLYPVLPAGATSPDFFNFDPLTGNLSNVTNVEVNYGWEYVWHCHILGHEENDMMRAIAVAQPPEAPTNLTAATVPTGVKLDWTDNSIISNWVTIQRALDSTFTTGLTTLNVVEPECTVQAGCPRSYTDTSAPEGTSVYYRIMANNTVGAGDGKLDAPRNPNGSYGAALPPELSALTPGLTGFANVTANSNWSGTASRLVIPTANVTPGPLTFTGVINSTSAPQLVTVSNTGNGNLAISGVALTTGTQFGITNNCPVSPATLAPGANCTISVTFQPTAEGSPTDTLTITDNTGGVAGSVQTVALSGTATVPTAVVPATPLNFSGLVNTTTGVQTVSVSNSGTGPLTIASINTTAPFVQTNDCGASLVAGGNCTISVSFNPTVAGPAAGTLTITDNTGGVAGSTQNVTLSGEGVTPLVPVLTAALSSTPPATVNMSWTASSSVASQPDSYQLQRTAAFLNPAAACPAYADLGAATSALTATDTSIVANRTYCYRVIATNAAGAFISTPAVKVTTPMAPMAPNNLTITGITPTELIVGWGTNGESPTGYEVQQCQGLTAANVANSYQCGAAGAGWTSLGTTAATSYTVTGLSTGTPHLYRVRAYNPVTSGFVTSTVVAYPLAAANSATGTASISAIQSINVGNVLTNDLPTGAAGRTVINKSAVTHVGGNANPAVAALSCTTAGACTLTLISPAANNTGALRQASKRGTYTFDYTEQYVTNYGIFTSGPVTVTITVN
ncbi:MAG: choice-of-anchor D domain-containing protein [Methylococcaceae bacterium]|nr:choice-of-anchor D domain-containing protein [Methylococcaceae bacterium]